METGSVKFLDVETDKPIIEVKIVDGTVWMTVNELADLFGVYTPTISKQLKVIFKDNLLRENEVTKEYRYTASEGGNYIRTDYNLETIIFLSFRIQTIYAKAFREWIFRKIGKQDKNDITIVMCNWSAKECYKQKKPKHQNDIWASAIICRNKAYLPACCASLSIFSLGKIYTSTRRFCVRPAAVELSTIGLVDPIPSETIRDPDTPFDDKNV